MKYLTNLKSASSIVACLCLVAVSLNIYQAHTNIDLSDGATFFKKYYLPNSYGLKQLLKFKHACIHSKIVEIESRMDQPTQAFDESLRDVEDISKYVFTEVFFNPIRITMDYSNLSDNSATTLQFVTKSIVPAILNFFQDTVTVQRLTWPLKVDPYYTTNNCGAANIVIPKAHITSGVPNTDLIYYVKTYREESNTLAYASYCPQGNNYGLTSGRPTVAYMNINLKHLEQDILTKNPMSLAKWIFICIHEVTHSLVFSPNYFNNFLLDKNPVVIEKGKSYVVAPSVLKIGQQHFGCPFLKRLPLEDEGGEGTYGTHWERKVFGNELMTGSQLYDSVISKFTAQMFFASGWYRINDGLLGTLTWGTNEGCTFTEYTCPKSSQEFCTGNGHGCSYDYTGTGYCNSSDKLSDKCSYWSSYSNTRCNSPNANFAEMSAASGGASGADTRCFNSDLPKSAGYNTATSLCLQSWCDYSGLYPQVNFVVSGKNYKCMRGESSIKIIFKGNVNCPDPVRFCQSPAACPYSCTGRGACKNGKCTCYKGFSGNDCSIIN